MKERVAAAVLLPEARPVRHVAEQLPGVFEPELRDAGGQPLGERALAGHGEPPGAVAPPQAREHLCEKQRVLLGIEPADAEHPQAAVPRPRQCVLDRTISERGTSENPVTRTRPPERR